MSSTSTIVMAGGLGTRMRSRHPKVLHELCGRPMLEWTVEAARAGGAQDIVVVVSPEIRADVEARLPALRVAVQEEPLGTADAVRAGLAALDATTEQVVVLSGDTPAIHAETVANVLGVLEGEGSAAALVTARIPPPSPYGRVLRDGSGRVTGIVEARDASAEELTSDEINVGLYAFEADALRSALARVDRRNVQGELYLTDAIGVLARDGARVVAVHEDDPQSCEGVNTMVELAAREALLRQRLCESAMLRGVRVVDPVTTYLDWSVELEPGCVIEPFTSLRGSTRVAEDAVVGPYAMAIDADVGRGVRVGPFAYLRPGTVLGEGSSVGRFVEVKNAMVGARAKIPHLSYIGDAEIGEDTNIGAGNITANYDGASKHRTVIGARVHTSSDTVFVAPVELGDDSFTGAGSVITDDVPPGALGISRGRQTTIEGYAARRAERGR